jgi:hypothetical protein
LYKSREWTVERTKEHRLFLGCVNNDDRYTDHDTDHWRHPGAPASKLG